MSAPEQDPTPSDRTDPTEGRTRLLRALRRPGDALPSASIGCVPILWNNVDQPDLAPAVDPGTVLGDATDQLTLENAP